MPTTFETAQLRRAPSNGRPKRAPVAPALASLAALSVAAAILSGSLDGGHASPTAHRHAKLHSISVEWPGEGQAAIAVVGLGHRSSPDQRPAPIASVAKVMTAYVVLSHDPLPADAAGFTLTFSEWDSQLAQQEKADGQSYVPVVPGESMTEREALEALLLPSANNIAVALATRVDGSVAAFVGDMNATAARLGMRDTSYTDPSGYDPRTVSTAADQLRLARAAMRIPAFAAIVGMPRATIPVAGTVVNTDSLLGHDGFVGIKTGSDDAAGGCFMFEAVRPTGSRDRRIIGVVLGQTGGPYIGAALSAASRLVDGVAGQL